MAKLSKKVYKLKPCEDLSGEEVEKFTKKVLKTKKTDWNKSLKKWRENNG